MMAKCDICGKNMPPNVVEAHKAKSHNGEVKEVAEEEETEEKETSKEEEKSEIEALLGEIRECGLCHAKFPDKIMAHHMHVTHGM